MPDNEGAVMAFSRKSAIYLFLHMSLNMLGQAPAVAVAVAAVPPQPASLPLSDRVSINWLDLQYLRVKSGSDRFNAY